MHHVACHADAPTTDAQFHVRANGLVLTRAVSMYQWVEHEDDSRTGHSTPSYSKEWVDSPIRSASFHEPVTHKNPAMPVRSHRFVAAAHCGSLALAPSLTGILAHGQPLALSTEQFVRQGWTRNARGLYKGADPRRPAIGDIKVSYYVIPNQTVSIASKNKSGLLCTYQSTHDTPIAIIVPGTKSARALFKSAQAENRIDLWLWRLAGFVLMLFGFLLITVPLSTIRDWLPIVGEIIGEIDFIVSFVLAAAATLITIAIGWTRARPELSTMIFAVSAGLVALLALRHAVTKRRARRN